MSDRWEERKEQLTTLRIEYGHLFTDLHFFQGLRFAVLGALLPVAAGLFSYYRAALPFVKDSIFQSTPATPSESYLALLIAIISLMSFLAVFSVDLGIRHQTRALITRGVVVEDLLDIQNGAFAALQNRIRTVWEFTRISGIITIGFYSGLASTVFFAIRALLNIL